MNISSYAGKPAKPSMLIRVPELVTACYTVVPDPAVPEQRVAFGTSGQVIWATSWRRHRQSSARRMRSTTCWSRR